MMGDKDSILGFKAVGFKLFPVTEAGEAQNLLERLANEQYAVIYVTEQVAKDILPAIERYADRKFPAIIPIPGNQGSLGLGIQGVKKSVERAVGADILFRDE